MGPPFHGRNALSEVPYSRIMSRQRSPDRQASIARRRHLAASGPMPPALAARFTQAEMAAFRIVSDKVRHHGVCALHIDAIAARAGTCRTTVKNALREARRLKCQGLIQGLHGSDRVC
jgi:hypothetical protein